MLQLPVKCYAVNSLPRLLSRTFFNPKKKKHQAKLPRDARDTGCLKCLCSSQRFHGRDTAFAAPPLPPRPTLTIFRPLRCFGCQGRVGNPASASATSFHGRSISHTKAGMVNFVVGVWDVRDSIFDNLLPYAPAPRSHLVRSCSCFQNTDHRMLVASFLNDEFVARDNRTPAAPTHPSSSILL